MNKLNGVTRKLSLLSLAVLANTMMGCASEPEQSYREQLANRALPTTSEDKQYECSWIRGEIARMYSVMDASTTSEFALVFQAKARKNISALESRASLINCRAAFSSTSIIQGSSIKECVEVCKENTSKTPEQCFNVCND
jgi:hypothetical protein